MKFRLSAAGSFYKSPDLERLQKLGFVMEPHESAYGTHWLDKDLALRPTVEINTLEELLAFIGEHGCVMVHDGQAIGGPNSICPPEDRQPWIHLQNDYD